MLEGDGRAIYDISIGAHRLTHIARMFRWDGVEKVGRTLGRGVDRDMCGAIFVGTRRTSGASPRNSPCWRPATPTPRRSPRRCYGLAAGQPQRAVLRSCRRPACGGSPAGPRGDWQRRRLPAAQRRVSWQRRYGTLSVEGYPAGHPLSHPFFGDLFGLLLVRQGLDRHGRSGLRRRGRPTRSG